jgi:hypothetical protein
MSEITPHEAARASLERKLHVVRDQTTGVAQGFKTGLYLYGTGGVGKSFTVLRQLEKLRAPHKLFNTRMTGKGLFLALAEAPDLIHVLEDMERVTKDPDAQGVLRSALWSQPGHDRVVTWTTATSGRESFTFRGGLILISNRALSDLPELRAMATRIEVHRLEVSEAEITALMRDLAAAGHRVDDRLIIAPEESMKVTEFLLKECRAAGCPLDLRLQQKAFQTYLQFAADRSVTHWEDLVAASVREATCHFRHEVNTTSPEARKTVRRNIVREVMAASADAKVQVQSYTEKTGASRSDFFRR